MKRDEVWEFIGVNWLPLLTVAAGIIAAALQLFGVLSDTVTLSIILTILCLLATTEIVERAKRFDSLDNKLEDGIERVLSTIGGEIKIHRGRDQFLEYITERINQATKRIDIVVAAGHGTRLYAWKREVHDRCLAAIKEAAQQRRVRVRRVRGLHNAQVLQQTIAEIAGHLGAEFYVAAYPLQNKGEAPLLNVMIVDDEVAIGGIHKAQSEDVITVTSRHPLVLEVIDDYFNTLWSRSVKLNTHSRLFQGTVSRLRDDLLAEFEYIDSVADNLARSAEIVSEARRRIWVASTLTSGSFDKPGKEVYRTAIEGLLRDNPEVEYRRIRIFTPKVVPVGTV